eukprot:Em0011g22a
MLLLDTGILSSDALLNVGTYDAGEKYNISLAGLTDVPTITIVQARLNSGYYTTVGSFSSFGYQQSVVACRNQYDTLISNETSVTFEWTAPNSRLEGIRFHYTVVTQNGSKCFDSISDVIYPREPHYIKLIQAHGSMMIVAWCVLVPCAILLALFYKTVCFRGEWFYIHIVIQVGAMLLNIASIVVIFTYGNFNGDWTTTTNLNWPHQIIGLIAFVALMVNPFIAICRCHQDNPLRWVYNYIHGSIGMVALLCSLTSMLLGLHIYKTLVGYTDYSHYAIYALSGTVTVILSTIALYNIYALNFNIRTATKSYIDPDVPSSDYCCRVIVAVLVVSLLVAGTASTIAMIALA